MVNTDVFGEPIPEPEPKRKPAKEKAPRKPTAKQLRLAAPEIQNRHDEDDTLRALRLLHSERMLSAEDVNKYGALIEPPMSPEVRDKLQVWKESHAD